MAIKVLWVDDDISVKNGIEIEAKQEGIRLVWFSNWEDAKDELYACFTEYEAIVLDAYCHVYKKDTILSDDFLHVVWGDLKSIFGHFHSIRPWYILSEGTMSNFDQVIKRMNEHRNRYSNEWGDLVYYKSHIHIPSSTENISERQNQNIFDNPGADKKGVSELWKQIVATCSTPHHWPALERHLSAFEYLGSDKYFKGSARHNLMNILSALYEPTKYNGFVFEDNPIRRIFECLVHAGVERGVIPPEAIGAGNVKCMEASRFICGSNPLELPYRYGKESDRILDSTESSMLITILSSTNIGSHESTSDNNERNVTLNEDNRDEYSGCALLMCRIIKAFGRYLDQNNDIEENKKKWRPNPKLLEDKIVTIESAPGVYYAENCLLSHRPWLKEGMKIRLTDVV